MILYCVFTLEVLRENDSLVVWKLDRPGRSVKDLVTIVCDLEQRGVHFKCVTDQIDTSTTSGRFFFHVMASLAQMERDLTAERTRAGLDAARRQGRTGERKRKMTDSKIIAAKQLLQDGTSPREVAKNLGVNPDSVPMGAGDATNGIGGRLESAETLKRDNQCHC